MVRGQTRESHQTPIATDAQVASSFLAGLEQTIRGSKNAYPSEAPTDKIGKGSMPKPGVWGNGFCKP